MADKQTGKSSAKKELHCPFCDEEIRQLNLPWCQACGVTITVCATCGKPTGKHEDACPHCGAKVSEKGSSQKRHS